MEDRDRITSLGEIPDDTTFLFTVREKVTEETAEAILIRTADEITAWMNYCRHFTHVRLDTGSGGELREDEIVCTSHGAMFDATSGECTYGPCEGAVLESIAVRIEEDSVYLADPGYEFVSVGPDDSESTDLTSTSNPMF